jgi:hypothetical protein
MEIGSRPMLSFWLKFDITLCPVTDPRVTLAKNRPKVECGTKLWLPKTKLKNAEFFAHAKT